MGITELAHGSLSSRLLEWASIRLRNPRLSDDTLTTFRLRGRTTVASLLIALGIAAYVERHHPGILISPYREVLTNIRPEIGYAFIGPLRSGEKSADQHPSDASLLEDGVPLHGANSPHDDIRTIGAGRFSFWHSQVYFSASDNSDPRLNGRVYVAYWHRTLPRWASVCANALSALGVLLLVIPLLARRRQYTEGVRGVPPTAPPQSSKSGDRTTKWLRPTLSLIATLVSLVVLEVGVRLVEYRDVHASLAAPTVPGRWDPELGNLYVANSEFRYWVWNQGNKEFETTQRVNSLGFADVEPPAQVSTQDLSIMILGDSFVEALQVEMNEKLGPLVKAAVEQRLQRRIAVTSFGRSGTGQAVQYAYFRKFAPRMKPDIVVLVFISNDLRDNHPDLTARYYRFNPLHPPRPTFVMSENSEDGLLEVPIDPQWNAYTSLVEAIPAATVKDVDPLQSVLELSALARLVLKRSASPTSLFPPEYLYKGNHVDFAFMERGRLQTDPVIQAGYTITDRLIKKFKNALAGSGGDLVIMVGDAQPLEAKYMGGAEFAIFHNWLEREARDLNLPFVSVPQALKARNIDWHSVIRSDGHWNQSGHRLAAAILEETLVSIVNRRQSAVRPQRDQ